MSWRSASIARLKDKVNRPFLNIRSELPDESQLKML
jgi:hypothetical protein